MLNRLHLIGSNTSELYNREVSPTKPKIQVLLTNCLYLSERLVWHLSIRVDMGICGHVLQLICSGRSWCSGSYCLTSPCDLRGAGRHLLGCLDCQSQEANQHPWMGRKGLCGAACPSLQQGHPHRCQCIAPKDMSGQAPSQSTPLGFWWWSS